MERFDPFYVDRATTARAKCQLCKKPCEKNELRMAKQGIGPYGDGKLMKSWFHLNCMMDSFLKQRKTTKRISSVSEIGNFNSLSQEDKDLILEMLNNMEKLYSKKNNTPLVTIDTSETNNVADKVDKEDSSDFDHEDNSFRRFHSLCKNIAKNNKYTAKTEVIKEFFDRGSEGTGFKGDISLWVKLLLPGIAKRVYNLKDKQLIKLFSRMLNADHDDMLTDLENGNVGETIEKFFKTSKNVPPSSTLNLLEVNTFLSRLTDLTKEDEQVFHFKSIIKKCTGEDIKYLIYLIKGDLRMNAGCKHVLGALHPDAYSKYQSTSDLDSVLSMVVSENGNQQVSPKKLLNAGGIEIMKPISPMLAKICSSVEMAMEKCPNGMLSEIKYDGERVQLHKSKNEFKYFSRSLKPVLNHKIENIKKYIHRAFPHGHDLILDCEILMNNVVTGEILPFGTLGIHKKNENSDAVECLFVFDCLYYNGESLIDLPIRERRKILEKNMTEVKHRIMFSVVEEIHRASHLNSMIAKVLEQGLEGLVLKDLNSKYEPGKRHWLKMKKDSLKGGAMADSADLVVLGAWFGTGRKGGLLSTFLMGCHDTDRNKWLTVTKVSGLDDDTLASLQDPMKESMIKISKDANRVPNWLSCSNALVPDFIAKNPEKQPVWEIIGTEFSKANGHTAGGISIRFPRVAKRRPDKTFRTATNFKELKTIFEKSKKSIDYSHMLGVDESSGSKVHPENVEKEMEALFTSTKRKYEENGEGSSSKKTKVEDNDDGVFVVPKNPLPNIFDKCCLYFYINKTEKYEECDIEKLKRLWIAYGGEFDDREDGSGATHVIHFENKMKLKNYEKYLPSVSKRARHVTHDWVPDCVLHKSLLNTNPYAVMLLP